LPHAFWKKALRYFPKKEIIMADAYKKLAIHLDSLPGGFPATRTGVEIRILQRLFSDDEALIATALRMMPESSDVIAERLGMPATQLEPLLDRMSRKGLIFRISRAHPQYMAAQFVIGIWEYHVNDLDPGLIKDFNEYVPYLTQRWSQQKTNQLRVIPVSKSLSPDTPIMPYEVAEEIINSHSKIAVAPCICRKEHQLAGSGCDNPLEVCLSFGSGAYYYEQNGLGRAISQKEALAILQQGIAAGLVLQPGNSRKAMNICMCCGCCCQILKNIKLLPEPAKAVNSSYYAAVDQEACIGCGMCAERCHMAAVTVDDGVARVDLKRCIGCGVCAPTCDAEAVKLLAKPNQEQWVPPASVFDTYFKIASERGL
jgi:H+/Na+-translocating ferredoxin:NAD+ oxidoreductase subunit B